MRDAPLEPATTPEAPAASSDVGQTTTLPATGAVVLDASFVIALLQRHPGATALSAVLPRGILTAVTAGEVFYKIAATAGTEPQRIEAVLRALRVRVVDLPLAAAHHFPRLRRIDAGRQSEQKARGEKAASLSLADLCVLGYALAADLPVLTGDRHWTTLQTHGLTVPMHRYQSTHG